MSDRNVRPLFKFFQKKREVMGVASELKLNCMAIGSLPHKKVDEAMVLIKKHFSKIPFWAQLAKLNKNEDMIFQFLENMPGIVLGEEKIYLENEDDKFFEQLEEFFIDYEEIIADTDSEILNKYAISENNSSTFRPFIEIIKETKPQYAKGQITGPFTLTTTLVDKYGKCAYYDETLREVIVKTLILKAIWQIKEIKKANSTTTPIIFIDEPSISQLGTSAFITISQEEVVEIIKEISDIIKENGALSAIHCCGKCDWAIPMDAGVDIINLDGYFFAQNLSLFHEKVAAYIKNGGIIAWGIIPTLDKNALEEATLDTMSKKFDEAIDFLVKKGIDKELLLTHSMITPSCGAGSLSIELAEKAMDLTEKLSKTLKEKF